MKNIATLLEQYQSANAEQLVFKSRMIALLKGYGAKAFSRELLHAHFTASAWILNREQKQVLLIHHSKLNKWLQPGGHADGNQHLYDVALKEAQEEVGLSYFIQQQEEVFDLDIHEIPARKNVPSHYHYDVRFKFISDNKNVVINHESKDFKWVDLENVSKITKEESILRMVRKSLS